MLKRAPRHAVIRGIRKTKISLVDNNHRISTFLQKKLHIVWRKGISRGIVGRRQQYYPGLYASNERDDFIHLITETRPVGMHRILYDLTADFACNRLIVPPRVLRNHHRLVAGKIAMDNLFQHILTPVTKKNTGFRKIILAGQCF